MSTGDDMNTIKVKAAELVKGSPVAEDPHTPILESAVAMALHRGVLAELLKKALAAPADNAVALCRRIENL